MQRPIRFTAAGDILITRRLPAAGDSALREAIAASDVRLANLETTITDGTRYASAYSGGTWLTADPGCLADVARLGFNVLGFANNHTMDYSYGGLEDTLQFLRQEGIAAAGAGQNLFEAARPAIVETPGGRAAVFAVCATFEDAARAGSQTESMPGRPGLNPLRVQTVYRVARPRAQALREAAARTGVNALRQAHRSQGFLPPLPEGTMEFGPVLLEEVESEAQEGRFSRADERDVQRTLEGVRRARAACQAVVVLVHSHEIKAACEEEPDYFLEDFARRCIDAGASAVVGSGTHQVQGIEIYNGCPIFYCLGNFFFENDTVEKLPADFLEKYGVSLGTFGYGIDSSDLRNHILLEIPELSYIAVNVRGCRAYVQVRERQAAPELVNKREPGNTVARRDALVTAIQPYDGQKMVLPGTMVQEGALLISGVTDDEQAGTRFLRGMGKVYGRTWYTLRCQVPAVVEEKQYTGEEYVRFALCWGNRRINLYAGGSPALANCDKTVERTPLTLPGGIALPITLVKETYRVYEIAERERTQAEAEELGRTVLEAYLLAGLDEGTVEEAAYTSIPWEGSILTELNAECQEQIGIFVPIPKEEAA